MWNIRYITIYNDIAVRSIFEASQSNSFDKRSACLGRGDTVDRMGWGGSIRAGNVSTSRT